MIVREAKLKSGTAEQYSAIDEAIRTAQFIRNKAVHYWMENQGTNKADLYIAILFDWCNLESQSPHF